MGSVMEPVNLPAALARSEGRATWARLWRGRREVEERSDGSEPWRAQPGQLNPGTCNRGLGW